MITRTPKPGTVKKLIRAAALIAQGMTMQAAADKLGVSRQLLAALAKSHPGVWMEALEGAAEKSKEFAAERMALIEAVRESARSMSVPLDVAGYIQAARLAETFAEADGIELFPDGGDMTLTRFYREWYVPNRLTDASPLTRSTYEATLSRWRLLTGDPPLAAITAATLAKFRDSLKTCRVGRGIGPMSPTTVARHLRHANTLLGKAGQPGPRNRDAAGFIKGHVPWVKSPRMVVTPPRIVEEREITACYEAAGLMDRPVGLPCKPGDWWRALVVTAWNTGLRTGSLLSLRWQDIDWEKRTVTISPERIKSRRWHVVPLNTVVLDHLRKIRRSEGIVFDWPLRREAFYVAFRRLQSLAGIGRHFGVHDIRKTMATRLWGVAPEAAVLALGHAGADVTLRHYIEGPAIVARAFDRLGQPEAFTKGGSTSS